MSELKNILSLRVIIWPDNLEKSSSGFTNRSGNILEKAIKILGLLNMTQYNAHTKPLFNCLISISWYRFNILLLLV